MKQSNRQMRVLFSIIGLVCVVCSLALAFLAPGTWWNWAALLVAFAALLISRRF